MCATELGRAFAATILASAFACGAAFAGPSSQGAPSCGDRGTLVGIYPRPFEGEPQLAAQISAIVSTELLASLRTADESAPQTNFGRGLVEPIGDGKPKCSQLALSGRVLPLGDDALFFATLEKVESNDKRKDRPELWTVAVGERKVSLNVLRDRYVFPPTKIQSDIRSSYASLHAMKLCALPSLPCTKGMVGYTKITAGDVRGPFLQVRLSDGRTGWLYLPIITNGNPVINFSAAIVRIERGDFLGAVSFLTDVINESTYVDAGLRLDALLLRAAATELARKDGRDDLAAAQSLSPESRHALQFAVMADLNRLVKIPAGEERDKLSAGIRDRLLQAEKLLSPGDPWLQSARSAISAP